MDAAVLHTLGRPPRYEQFPEPIAGDGEVIVHVHAASLKPIDKQMASGSHYASPRELPRVCGTDGVGHLSDRQRVFFGGARAPYGAMAQRAVVPRAFSFLVPEGVDDETAAALPNPGVSAWLSLAFRGKLTPGENVLILGATGVTGKLAVRIAKLLGAGRVVAIYRGGERRGRQRLQRIRFGRSATCRPRFACFNLAPGAAPYLCFWTLSNPFSNWVTSGVSPDSRPSRPMTRQR
jgi:NADPH:quinone reductase-like Zn-dependent oxidoreductase